MARNVASGHDGVLRAPHDGDRQPAFGELGQLVAQVGAAGEVGGPPDGAGVGQGVGRRRRGRTTGRARLCRHGRRPPRPEGRNSAGRCRPQSHRGRSASDRRAALAVLPDRTADRVDQRQRPGAVGVVPRGRGRDPAAEGVADERGRFLDPDVVEQRVDPVGELLEGVLARERVAATEPGQRGSDDPVPRRGDQRQRLGVGARRQPPPVDEDDRRAVTGLAVDGLAPSSVVRCQRSRASTGRARTGLRSTADGWPSSVPCRPRTPPVPAGRTARRRRPSGRLPTRVTPTEEPAGERHDPRRPRSTSASSAAPASSGRRSPAGGRPPASRHDRLAGPERAAARAAELAARPADRVRDHQRRRATRTRPARRSWWPTIPTEGAAELVGPLAVRARRQRAGQHARPARVRRATVRRPARSRSARRPSCSRRPRRAPGSSPASTPCRRSAWATSSGRSTRTSCSCGDDDAALDAVAAARRRPPRGASGGAGRSAPARRPRSRG